MALAADLISSSWRRLGIGQPRTIGENFPLLLVGLQEQDRQVVSELVERFDFADSLLVLPGVTPVMLPRLYQLSVAVFHPSQASPWCGSVRLALASGKPLVAVEESLTAAIAGPAAYLVRGDDARTFGAALVTVLVEQEIADSLFRCETKDPGLGK